jgi:hypothetical protein
LSLEEIRDQAERVNAWFAKHFPSFEVEALDDKLTETYLFRVRESRDREYGVSATYASLEDHPVAKDLESLGAAELLRGHPNRILPYIHETREILSNEQMWVTCDDRRYRIQRDGQHIDIFDQHDRRLANQPDAPRILQDSIYRRTEQSWRDEIRQLRGENQ